MDPIMKPIKTIRRSGLQVITMRAGREGLIAGEISIGVGAAHAAKIDPRWLGLPHFTEHLIANGASRNYGQDEAKQYLCDELFVNHNAWTNLFETRYFTTMESGYVLPARNFWDAFETTIDGVFFPKFDAPTMERERKRVLEEISQSLTPLSMDNSKFNSLIFGVDYMGYQTLGSPEQVESYTAKDCSNLHSMAYGLHNTCVVVIGDASHDRVLEEIEARLGDVYTSGTELPLLDRPHVQKGEFRRQEDDSNEGYVEVYLNFPAVNVADSKYYATSIAMNALSKIIEDKVKDKYGLYEVRAAHDNWATPHSKAVIKLVTGRKEIAADTIAYALEIMQASETQELITKRHDKLLARKVTQAETFQPTIEDMASYLNQINGINAPLLSLEEHVQRYRNTTAEDVAVILKELNESPMFMNIRGHADALDSVPSIDVVNTWRSSPNRASAIRSTANRQIPNP